MSNLSQHINKELSCLLTKIKQSPPKKVHSLKRLKELVKEVPLKQSEKKNISKSIHIVETAIKRSSSFKNKNKLNKKLFYENLLLQKQCIDRKLGDKRQIITNEGYDEYSNLVQKLKQVRKMKQQKQNTLLQLIMKSQRLERLIRLKHENEESKAKQLKLSEQFLIKRDKQEIIKGDVRRALIKNNSQRVHILMAKYNHIIQN